MAEKPEEPAKCPACGAFQYTPGFNCQSCGFIDDAPEDQLDSPWNDPDAPFGHGDY